MRLMRYRRSIQSGSSRCKLDVDGNMVIRPWQSPTPCWQILTLVKGAKYRDEHGTFARYLRSEEYSLYTFIDCNREPVSLEHQCTYSSWSLRSSSVSLVYFFFLLRQVFHYSFFIRTSSAVVNISSIIPPSSSASSFFFLFLLLVVSSSSSSSSFFLFHLYSLFLFPLAFFLCIPSSYCSSCCILCLFLLSIASLFFIIRVSCLPCLLRSYFLCPLSY